MSWGNEVKEKQDAPTQPEFDFTEDEGSDKTIYLVYGNKGEGKTTASFSFPGTIACLSFDRKSSVVKKHYYNADERIKVYDAIKYLDESIKNYTASSQKTIDYIDFLLDNLAKNEESRPDYVIIDGLDILQKIAEMVMRHQNNLAPFQGVANPNLWKIRTLVVRGIHNKALAIAKKGLIYTTYIEKNEVVIEGSTVTKTDNPKWADIILWQTDVVLRVKSNFVKGGRKTTLTVESSKTGDFKTGDVLDVTDKKLLENIKEVK